jgi:2,4-dienoyl-CoA reductase-like NADH-dependent reductase (Old Yellow Enzyme family)
MEGGITVEDTKTAAPYFEQAGVDMLDISGGFCSYTIPGNNEQGYFSSLSEAVKSVVSIPVNLTGGITDPAAAQKLLAEGKADLIGVGRAILKDPDWAKNAVEGLQ